MKSARIALGATALGVLAAVSGCVTSATSKHFSPTPTATSTPTPIPTTTESRTTSFTRTPTFSPTATVGASLASSNKVGPSGALVRNAPAHFYVNVAVSGGAPATNVVVADTLDPNLDPATIVFWSGPSGAVSGATITWSLGTLVPPTIVTLHFSANVLASAAIGTSICNSATITSGSAATANVGPVCFTVIPSSPTFSMTSTATRTSTPTSTVTRTSTITPTAPPCFPTCIPAIGGISVTSSGVTLTPNFGWQTVSGSYTSAQGILYGLCVTAGITYEFTFCAGTGGAYTGDPYLWFGNSACAVYAANDDSCGLGSYLTTTSGFTGPAALVVTSCCIGGQAGTYTLAYRRL